MFNKFKQLFLLLLLVLGIYVLVYGFIPAFDRYMFFMYWSVLMLAVYFYTAAKEIFAAFSVLFMIFAVVLYVLNTNQGGLVYYFTKIASWSFIYILSYVLVETYYLVKSND